MARNRALIDPPQVNQQQPWESAVESLNQRLEEQSKLMAEHNKERDQKLDTILKLLATKSTSTPDNLSAESSLRQQSAPQKGSRPLILTNLDKRSDKPAVPFKSSDNPPFAKMTLDQKRSLGLCFRCGEKFHPGHKCSSRFFRCFLSMLNSTAVKTRLTLHKNARRAIRSSLHISSVFNLLKGMYLLLLPLLFLSLLLLKKDAFHWSPQAQQAFSVLKMAMTQAPVLALPPAELHAVTELIPTWVADIQASYVDDSWIDQLKKTLATGEQAASDLPMAQYWYNTSYHSALQTTPFQALYGYPPPLLSTGCPPRSNIEAVDAKLRLPIGSTIHPVLHVSQLKGHVSRGQPVTSKLPLVSSKGQLKISPQAILDRRAIK